jgi:hypothetical protein
MKLGFKPSTDGLPLQRPFHFSAIPTAGLHRVPEKILVRAFLLRKLNLEDVRCKMADCVSAKDMTELVLKLEPKTQLSVILLLRLWWDERSKYREEGRRRFAVEVVFVTAALTDRFQEKGKGAQPLLSESRHTMRWIKPQYGEFKVNSDGAFDYKTGSGGWGYIIRYDQGSTVKAGVVARLSCRTEGSSKFGNTEGSSGDDAVLVKIALEDDAYRLSAMSGILTELQLLLMTDFGS